MEELQEIREISRARWSDGANYDAYISEELGDFRADAWLRLVEQKLGCSVNGLEVLDIGCGPGFFPCVLGGAGAHVTGVDFSEDMLRRARANTRERGVEARLLQMDAQALSVPSSSFDLVLCRNVTWTLQEPERAYAEWLRVLRPGATLLVFDANWHSQFYDDEVARQVRANEERYRERYGREFKVCTDDPAYRETLPLVTRQRPAWDVAALARAGYEDIDAQLSIDELVYQDWERDLYAATPLFCVRAHKPLRATTKERTHAYWQERSATFGIDPVGVNVWGSLIASAVSRLLPGLARPSALDESGTNILVGCPTGLAGPGALDKSGTNNPVGCPMRVLDVGCGTGAMSLAAAHLGYAVTGVDFCSNMLEQARQNAREDGCDITFVEGDASSLPFPDERFDLVINRNVLWNLTDPDGALAEWFRVLRPGGLLAYFDAAWYAYLYDAKLDANRRRTDAQGTQDRFQAIEDAAHDMPLTHVPRPAWDREHLARVGFAVEDVEDVSSRVWTAAELERFSYAAQFMVVARRPTGEV